MNEIEILLENPKKILHIVNNIIEILKIDYANDTILQNQIATYRKKILDSKIHDVLMQIYNKLEKYHNISRKLSAKITGMIENTFQNFTSEEKFEEIKKIASNGVILSDLFEQSIEILKNNNECKEYLHEIEYNKKKKTVRKINHVIVNNNDPPPEIFEKLVESEETSGRQ